MDSVAAYLFEVADQVGVSGAAVLKGVESEG